MRRKSTYFRHPKTIKQGRTLAPPPPAHLRTHVADPSDLSEPPDP